MAKSSVKPKMYAIMTDGILVGTPQKAFDADGKPTIEYPDAGLLKLQGQVSSTQLQLYGVDIQWLLSTGALVEVGYSNQAEDSPTQLLTNTPIALPSSIDTTVNSQ